MASLTNEAKTEFDLANQAATVEFQGPLLQLQAQVLDLRAANYKLRKENKELRERIEIQEKAKVSNKVYFCYSDEVPFCPDCFKKQGLLIHLTGPVSSDNEQAYNCPECRRNYRMSR